MSVAEEAVTASPTRIYTEAGGLSWALAGAWRCAAMVLLLGIWLSGSFFGQESWTGREQDYNIYRICRDTFFLSVAAFAAYLFLGEEVAAKRIRQTFKDLISHGIWGLLSAANLLFFLLLPIAFLRQFNIVWDLLRLSWRQLAEETAPLWSIAIPLVLFVGLVLGIRSGVRRTIGPADEFIRQSVKRGGRTGVIAGMVLAGAFLLCALASKLIIQNFYSSLDEGSAIICFCVSTVKAGCTGYAVALSSSWLITRYLPPSYWFHAIKIQQRGLVIGGLLSLGFGLLYSLFCYRYAPFMAGYISMPPSLGTIMCSWLADYHFSGGLFMGALLGTVLGIWKIRTAFPHSEVIQVNE